MSRHRLLASASALLLALTLAGCARGDGSSVRPHPPEAGLPPEPGTPLAASVPADAGAPEESAAPADAGGPTEAGAPGGAGTPTDAATDTTVPDPLDTSEDGRPRGPVDQVLRAEDGTTLVALGAGYADRTHLRLYDREWRPITPLLTVEVSLDMVRGLRHGFVGQATTSTRSGRYSYRAWVVIDRQGRLREVSRHPVRGSRPVPVRSGDVALTAQLSYRPGADAVVTSRRPAWHRRFDLWYAGPTGTICTHPSRTRVGEVVRASVDEGRTWRELATSVLPEGSGPRVQSCGAEGDRVVVMTGGEYPRWLHTLDRTSGALLSSHVLMTDINGYGWTLLPDGRVVADTKRRGLMVGTDPTNETIAYRAGPVRGSTTTHVLGDEIVAVGLGRGVQVSSDAGRTWQPVDLRLTD